MRYDAAAERPKLDGLDPTDDLRDEVPFDRNFLALASEAWRILASARVPYCCWRYPRKLRGDRFHTKKLTIPTVFLTIRPLKRLQRVKIGSRFPAIVRPTAGSENATTGIIERRIFSHFYAKAGFLPHRRPPRDPCTSPSPLLAFEKFECPAYEK